MHIKDLGLLGACSEYVPHICFSFCSFNVQKACGTFGPSPLTMIDLGPAVCIWSTLASA
jgi:hypothetical protein